MRRIVLTILGAVAFCVSSATQYMRVEYTDKMIHDYDVEDVQDVEYSADETTMTVNLKNGNVRKYALNEIERVCVDTSIYGSYGYVDLGLSVLWSTCNLGASKPNELGTPYAWGEVSKKESYTRSNYEWYEYYYDESNMTKYCKPSCPGFNGYVDYLSTLLPQDDAATMNMGGYWRMPTSFEWQELIDECEWKWDGNGYTVTGRNGNSIFIRSTVYWTSETSCGDGWVYQITPAFCNKSFQERYEGNAIRPVAGREYNRPIFKVSFRRQDGSLFKEVRVNYGKSVDASSVRGPFLKGFVFSGWDVEQLSNITSDMDVYPTYTELKTPEYVDLGLSVKWATFNMGATAPEEEGYLYRWGEVTPAFLNREYEVNSRTSYGQETEDPTKLFYYDDAASYNYSTDWRMPTYDECKELINDCEWTSYKLNGVDGFKVTGGNGNWIFLPKASYWTSEMYPMSRSEASTLTTTYIYPETYKSQCSTRLLIRPVYSK